MLFRLVNSSKTGWFAPDPFSHHNSKQHSQGWIRCVIKLLTQFIRIPESALKVDIPSTRAYAEDFLRHSATTRQGVTLPQVVSRLLSQAWKHRHVLVQDSAIPWQSEHLPSASDTIRSELLILLGSAIG